MFHLKWIIFCDLILYFTFKLDSNHQFSKCTRYNSSGFEVQITFFKNILQLEYFIIIWKIEFVDYLGYVLRDLLLF